jgi:hypothetical protein
MLVASEGVTSIPNFIKIRLAVLESNFAVSVVQRACSRRDFISWSEITHTNTPPPRRCVTNWQATDVTLRCKSAARGCSTVQTVARSPPEPDLGPHYVLQALLSLHPIQRQSIIKFAFQPFFVVQKTELTDEYRYGGSENVCTH